jgi:hypothetical protein
MNNKSYSTPLKIKAAPMTAGAVLCGAGAMMAMAGMIVGGTAMCSAARKWFRAQAMQPQASKRGGWGMRPKMKMPMPAASAANGNGNGAYARSGHA